MTGGGSADSALDGLESVTRRLSRVETEQGICDVAVDAVSTLFDRGVGEVWLYDADADEFQLTGATDRARALLEPDPVLDPGSEFPRAAFEAGEVRASEGEGGAARYGSASGVESELVVPVGEYGVVTVGAPEPGAFDERDVQLARILSTDLEAALTSAYREHELEVKNERLEEMVDIVSHDLRNPLQVSRGYLDIVREDVEDARLQKVADGLDRIERLVENLLTLTERGSIVDARSTVDLETLARDAWANVYTPDATLEVVETIALFGDEDGLLHVFENLYRNAIEHGEDDVHVRVGPVQPIHPATRVSAKDRTTGFFVEDDGPGIPEAERAEVFEAGWSTGGTGLGLAIVERVVGAHGWEISVDDRVGGGTRFEVVGGTKPVAPFPGG